MKKKVTLLTLVIALIALVGTMNVIANDNDNFLEKIRGKGIKSNGQPLEVGISCSSITDEMTVVLNVYPQWLLEHAGAKVTLIDANFDVLKQIDGLDDMMSMNTEAVIIHPLDNYALADAVQRVRQNDIQVIATNIPVIDRNETPIIDLYVGSPNFTMAAEAAKFLVEKAAGKNIKVVQIMGLGGTIITSERDRGFRSIIDQHPNIEIVDSKHADWMTDKAHTVMSDMLTATPDIWGVFAYCSNYAPAVLSAIEQAGRLFPTGHEDHIFYVDIDGAPPSLDGIRKGHIDMSVENNPYIMAVGATKGALMLAQGLSLPKYPSNIVDIPLSRITAENVDDIALWGNFGVPHDTLWPRTQEIFEHFKWPGDEKLYN